MPRFDPDIHHRRSIRLRNFDYASSGAYFVTICTYRREGLFGEIRNGKMILNELGTTVKTIWNELPLSFPAIQLDEYVIMPNHIHVVIWIVGAPLAGALGSTAVSVYPDTRRAGARPAPTLGDIVGTFKSRTTVAYIRHQYKNHTYGAVPKLWQRNYYEHIIRDEDELYRIRQYISDNPKQWEMDEENIFQEIADA